MATKPPLQFTRAPKKSRPEASADAFIAGAAVGAHPKVSRTAPLDERTHPRFLLRLNDPDFERLKQGAAVGNFKSYHSFVVAAIEDKLASLGL